MKLIYSFVATIFCLVFSTIIYTPSTLALEEKEIEQIAKDITVRIEAEYPGSGVIISKDKDIYTILTAAHVVNSEDKYRIITPDNKSYAVNYNTIKKLPGIDAAILQFESKQNYSVAKLSSYPVTNLNYFSQSSQPVNPIVYVYGFPIAEEIIPRNLPFLSPGNIRGLSSDLDDGYSIVYKNTTYAGMSGGPLLDFDGDVIGIHGKAYADSVYDKVTGEKWSIKFHENYGISTQTFVNSISSKEQNLDLSIRRKKIDWNNKSERNQRLYITHLPHDYPNTLTGKSLELLNLARASSNDRQERLRLVNKIIKINPDFYPAWFWRGFYLETVNWKEAAISYKKAVELKPNLSIGWRLLAISSANANLNSNVVVKYYDKAINIADLQDSYSSKYLIIEALNNKAGYLQYQLKNFDGAITIFNKAIKLAPFNRMILINKARTLRDAKRFRQALESYNNFLKKYPNNALVWNEKAWIYRKLNNQKKAIDSYSKAIELAQSNYILSQFHADKAFTLKKLGKYQEAIANYDKSIELGWASGVSNYWLYQRYASKAFNLEKLGRYEEAIANYNESFKYAAYAKIPAPLEWKLKADILFELKRYSQALQSYDRAYIEAEKLQKRGGLKMKNNYYLHDLILYRRYISLAYMNQAPKALKEMEELLKTRDFQYDQLYDLKLSIERDVRQNY